MPPWSPPPPVYQVQRQGEGGHGRAMWANGLLVAVCFSKEMTGWMSGYVQSSTISRGSSLCGLGNKDSLASQELTEVSGLCPERDTCQEDPLMSGLDTQPLSFLNYHLHHPLRHLCWWLVMLFASHIAPVGWTLALISQPMDSNEINKIVDIDLPITLGGHVHSFLPSARFLAQWTSITCV